MSILIRGMEMPKNCEECPLNHYECALLEKFSEEIMQYFGGDCRHPDCPLVEVLTPHGRLIDADALQLEAYNMMFRGHADDRDVAFVNFLLGKAPTIIESEGE